MSKSTHNMRLATLAVTTALATALLAGCATDSAPRADLSANKAQTALINGPTDKALSHAEAAALAEPHNVSYRTMLGNSYMDAGRFNSAATSFRDAMTLGDTSPRTALTLALAQIGSGDSLSARALLNDYREDIDPADLGLALALAGDANQGVQILTNAVRSGQNTSKVRQNLAYAYALMGDWRSARVMAAEDVPGDRINSRIEEWASTAAPENFHRRVAKLLEVPLVGDSGLPAQLVLTDTLSNQQMAAEATSELPPLAAYSEAATPVAMPVLASASASTEPKAANFDRAFQPKSPIPVQKAALRPVNQPVMQPVPARSASVQSGSRAPAKNGGDHMVQLGSFSDKQSAERAISIYANRYAILDRDDMVVSQARVNGKTYWRVSAVAMDRSEARSLCSTVKARGFGCIAYAAKRPLPGGGDAGARMARR